MISNLGILADCNGATVHVVLASIRFMETVYLFWYIQLHCRRLEKHPKMCRLIITPSLFCCKLPGTLIFWSWSNSASHEFFTFLIKLSKSWSFQSLPAFNISCMNFFALMTKGDKNPSGSNNLAIFFRKVFLVGLNPSSVTLDLKVNMF